MKIVRLIAFIVLGISTQIVLGQSRQVTNSVSDDVLKRQVPGTDSEYLTTVDAFSLILNYTGVPGGIVKIASCKQETMKQPVKMQGLVLREVLNAIVEADPRYHWQYENGVVNLLPTEGEPTLLKTPITQFDVNDVASAEFAADKLLALPEIQKKMQELHLSHGLKLLVTPSNPKPSTFSVHCKNASLREALNAIARAQGRAIWDYVEIHCDQRNEVVIRF